MSEEQEDGTLLQGSDGAVYFIPADRMSEFRVADEEATGVREALGELDSEDEVSGFSFDQIRPLKQGVRPLKAFEGPLGLRPTILQQNIGDGIWGG